MVESKLKANDDDYLMEIAWGFLWNITGDQRQLKQIKKHLDETPMNCEKFLRASGLVLFEKCYPSFKKKHEIVYNMMGLIGNIAEVEMLRCQLMKDELLTIFW